MKFKQSLPSFDHFVKKRTEFLSGYIISNLVKQKKCLFTFLTGLSKNLKRKRRSILRSSLHKFLVKFQNQENLIHNLACFSFF